MNAKTVSSEQELKDAFLIRKLVFVDEQQVPEELEMDEYDESATHIVLYDVEQPIGAGRFRMIDGIGKAERICVLSTHRNKGAGKLIMNQIEEVAKQLGVSKVKLNAQIHAEPFYKSIGYHTISDIFMDAGIPHVTMVKAL